MSRSNSHPRYLLANAERDGEKYAASLGVTSLEEPRQLSAARLLTGSAGDMQLPRAGLGAVFNMGGAAVANYLSILEAA